MMRWPRQILFGDVDAMFASAAVVKDPSLAGKPIAVGSPPPRGIIAAASYAVRPFGIHSAMPTAKALQLCPNLILLPPDRPLYRQLHNAMQAVTDQLFPLTEWSSIDEFYADTTQLQTRHPDPRSLGQLVKDVLYEATGLRCTIAVATGKTVAKIAADSHKPDGLVIVTPGTEETFLALRPLRALPGIGPKTAARLEPLGLKTIGELLDQRWDQPLRHIFGTRLQWVRELARGIDREPVVADRESKSLSHETTFEHDTSDLMFLEQTIRSFLGTLAHDLRVQGLAAGSFTVKLKDRAFQITTRQHQFGHPLNYDPAMWPSIKSALHSLARPQTCYRLIGLSLSGLSPATDSLFTQRQTQAVAALDGLIERFGSQMIRLGGIPKE
jgi:DNA polymerase IV